MEEILRELMGDAYTENMSKDDVQTFFTKQLLSSGAYINANKAKAEKNELNNKISELQSQLEATMTDADKKKKADDDMKKLIEDLQNQLSESKSSNSRMSAVGKLAEAKIKAGIKEKDADYEDFITNISFEDIEKTNKISEYVSKIVTNAYEAGKSEAIKNKLGKVGSFKDGDNFGSNEEKGSYGKELAKATSFSMPESKDFFEKR